MISYRLQHPELVWSRNIPHAYIVFIWRYHLVFRVGYNLLLWLFALDKNSPWELLQYRFIFVMRSADFSFFECQKWHQFYILQSSTTKKILKCLTFIVSGCNSLNFYLFVFWKTQLLFSTELNSIWIFRFITGRRQFLNSKGRIR